MSVREFGAVQETKKQSRVNFKRRSVNVTKNEVSLICSCSHDGDGDATSSRLLLDLACLSFSTSMILSLVFWRTSCRRFSIFNHSGALGNATHGLRCSAFNTCDCANHARPVRITSEQCTGVSADRSIEPLVSIAAWHSHGFVTLPSGRLRMKLRVVRSKSASLPRQSRGF